MDGATEEFMGILLGMIAVVITGAIPISYMVLRYRRARRTMELIHAERMAAIERGMELPPAALDVGVAQGVLSRSRTTLLPGLMWSLVGLAVFTASAVGADFEGPSLFLGLVFIAIGLAYLIYYYAEERKQLRFYPDSGKALTPQPTQSA